LKNAVGNGHFVSSQCWWLKDEQPQKWSGEGKLAPGRAIAKREKNREFIVGNYLQTLEFYDESGEFYFCFALSCQFCHSAMLQSLDLRITLLKQTKLGIDECTHSGATDCTKSGTIYSNLGDIA